MIVLGLTGSIGMGKSAVAQMFRDSHVPVFDADAEVHRLQARDSELIGQIEALFPGATGPAGVNRRELGRRVLNDPQALRRLTDIVHPAVAASRRRFLHRHRFRPLVVLDVPLLFETGGNRHVDAVAVVSAPFIVQRRRVLRRPGMTQRRFLSVLRLQMPDARKRRMADFIIPTGCPLHQTRAAVGRIICRFLRSPCP